MVGVIEAAQKERRGEERRRGSSHVPGQVDRSEELRGAGGDLGGRHEGEAREEEEVLARRQLGPATDSGDMAGA